MADVDVDPTTPVPTPVAAPAPAVVPPGAPLPPATDPDEADAQDIGGVTMVPLAALKAEREKAKDYRAKAQQFDQTVGYLQAVQPQLEYLRTHPDVMQGGAPPTTPPAVDPELVELAQTIDLYTRDGQPDVERAAKVAKLLDKKAQAALQPLQQQTARDKAVENFHRVSQLRTPDGQLIDQEALKQVWNATPPEMLADPNIAYVYAAAILGHKALQTPAPGAPQAPPLITEAPGTRSGPFAQTSPSDLQQRIMAIRGIDSKRYADLTKGWKPGQTNTLEED